jgi:hypothetical protein
MSAQIPASIPLMCSDSILNESVEHVINQSEVNSLADDRYVNFRQTFSEVLSDTIGEQNVGRACVAMFSDLPERFKNCFQDPAPAVPVPHSSPEANRLRQLRLQLARLQNPEAATASERPAPVTHTGSTMETEFRPMGSAWFRAANWRTLNLTDESETDDSDDSDDSM